MDVITYALLKKLISSTMVNISSISVGDTGLSIITNDGETFTIQDGKDYILTAADKEEIANMMSAYFIAEGGKY